MKIKTERIIKSVFMDKTEISKSRLNTCKSCQNLVNKGQCGLCGCIVTLKTKVPYEYCPANFWENTYVREDIGIVMVNLTPEMGKLFSDKDGNFTFQYNDLSIGAKSDINILIANARGDFFDSDLNIRDISVSSSCGCTIPSEFKKELLYGGKDADSYDILTVNYNTNKVGLAKDIPIRQAIRFSGTLNKKENTDLFWRLNIIGTLLKN